MKLEINIQAISIQLLLESKILHWFDYRNEVPPINNYFAKGQTIQYLTSLKANE